MKDLIKKILKEEVSDEYILEIPNLGFIPNVDLKSSGGKTNAWNELLRLLKGKPFIFDNDLNLEETKITSLENLQSVGGYLDLSECGELTSLGNLRSVGGYLDLLECKELTSLGSLQSVGDYLDLSECEELTSLGNLQSVGGDLYLEEAQITSLGNLKSVGGDLNLYGTPISEKYSEEEIRQMVDVKGEIYLK